MYSDVEGCGDDEDCGESDAEHPGDGSCGVDLVVGSESGEKKQGDHDASDLKHDPG